MVQLRWDSHLFSGSFHFREFSLRFFFSSSFLTLVFECEIFRRDAISSFLLITHLFIRFYFAAPSLRQDLVNNDLCQEVFFSRRKKLAEEAYRDKYGKHYQADLRQFIANGKFKRWACQFEIATASAIGQYDESVQWTVTEFHYGTLKNALFRCYAKITFEERKKLAVVLA